MEISTQILGLLFFLINCTATGFAKPAIPSSTSPSFNRDRLSELNGSILQLKSVSAYTYETMYWVRKDKSYPDRSYAKCYIPTYLLYNRSTYRFFNATTRTIYEHLEKIKNTLRPLFDASRPRNHFANKSKNETLRKDLSDLAIFLMDPIRILCLLGYATPGNIKYNSTKLTEHVKLYLKCAGFPINNEAVQFLRYVTFIEAVEIALLDLAGDLHFIQKYLSIKN